MVQAVESLQFDSVLSSFVDDCAHIWTTWLQDGPGSAASRKQRRERRFKTAVGRMTVFMVRPSVEFATSGGWGAFNWTRWRLRINQCYTGQDAIRYKDFVELCSTVYHETRHAEQFYRIAQGLAAGNLRLPDARAVQIKQQWPARGAIQSYVVTFETDAIDEDPRHLTATQRAHLIADRMRIPLSVAQHADRQRDSFASYLGAGRPSWFHRAALDEVNDWLRATYKKRFSESGNWIQRPHGPYRVQRNRPEENDARSLEELVQAALYRRIGHDTPRNRHQRRTDIDLFGA